MPTCEQLTGRMRDICEGTSGLPRDKENAYRQRWGLPPLTNDAKSVASPNLLTKAATFTVAVVKRAIGGFSDRSDAEIEELLVICKSCDKFSNEHCLQCGCMCGDAKTKYLNKLRWKSESCPLGKW